MSIPSERFLDSNPPEFAIPSISNETELDSIL
jgi:hypothetical protein